MEKKEIRFMKEENKDGIADIGERENIYKFT